MTLRLLARLAHHHRPDHARQPVPRCGGCRMAPRCPAGGPAGRDARAGRRANAALCPRRPCGGNIPMIGDRHSKPVPPAVRAKRGQGLSPQNRGETVAATTSAGKRNVIWRLRPTLTTKAAAQRNDVRRRRRGLARPTARRRNGTARCCADISAAPWRPTR
jgi:hypothetical protein